MYDVLFDLEYACAELPSVLFLYKYLLLQVVVDPENIQLCCLRKDEKSKEISDKAVTSNLCKNTKNKRTFNLGNTWFWEILGPNPCSEIISLSFICTNDSPMAYGHHCGPLGQHYCQRKIFSS